MKALKTDEFRSCCPVSCSLDVLGDSWSLLVIRDMLMMNKHEFSEFMQGDEGIATNILTDRLKRLQECSVVATVPHPKHKNKKLYYLTESGKALLPVLAELALWGITYRRAPNLSKEKADRLKRNPKKFKEDILKNLKAWEKENLK